MKQPYIIDHESFRKELEELASLLVKIGSKNDINKIVQMVQERKGWTTPAEMAFARHIATTLIAQVKLLDKTLSDFYAACDMVESTPT